MKDISGVPTSLHTAKAIAVVLCHSSTLDFLKKGAFPESNPLEAARAAGLLAAKQTAHLIPHCHSTSLDGLHLTYAYLEPDAPLADLESYAGKYGLIISAEGKAIGRAGVGTETLTSVTIAALTLYDLLHSLQDISLEIASIKLISQTGGPQEWKKYARKSHQAAVLVCSTDVAAGKREDRAGEIVQEILQSYGAGLADYQVVADETASIQQQIQAWVAQDIAFIFTTGGTGLGAKDCTVEAVKAILEREADGITEAMHAYGQMRTPLAMLSKMAAGSIGTTLVVTLPGSSNGVRESLEAILPAVFHARNMLNRGR
ncbi:MAG: bifunctional molybdenum cofactor biosynthesis protein MoaC/MoaB [Bacteroidota bacterium]